jgi:phosphatidyl-myo-inositol dimannoside synthase
VADALLVTSSFLPGRGGIESYLAELCSDLAPRVAVFAPATRDGKPIPSNLDYPAVGYNGSLVVPSGRARRAIERAAEAHSTRRILFGTPWPLALQGPSLAERGYGYAVIVHGAEVMVPAGVPLLRQRLLGSLQRAQALFCVSRFTRGRLETLLPSEGRPSLHLLLPRVDTTRFQPQDPFEARARLGLGLEGQTVVFFGRLVRRKGVHRLIGAYDELASRVRGRPTLVVAGTGPEEPGLRRLARAARARVRFLGAVRDADAPWVYAAADVFALPVADRWAGRESEGLGVALLEAAACGVACVTGRSGGTPEAVVDGTTGFVVNARRQADLVHALASLLQDAELARRMGAAGRRHVQLNFSGGPPEALLDWLRN